MSRYVSPITLFMPHLREGGILFYSHPFKSVGLNKDLDIKLKYHTLGPALINIIQNTNINLMHMHFMAISLIYNLSAVLEVKMLEIQLK